MSEKLEQLLQTANIKRMPMYRPGAVCAILGISLRTFSTMVTTYEKDADGNPRNPATLESYMLFRARRVTYQALEDFLKRNETWERLNADPAEIQLEFDFDGY